jgi:hypothetical protein
MLDDRFRPILMRSWEPLVSCTEAMELGEPSEAKAGEDKSGPPPLLAPGDSPTLLVPPLP